MKMLETFGRYLLLMGRTFSLPERFRMFWKQYIKEMAQLGVDSVGIVLLISFFIGAVICIQMKLNIQSPWMPRWVSGYTTREILLLEFSSSIMCLILAGKVGSNIASELGTMRVTQQIDALEIMGVNSASYLILPKIVGLITIMPFLVIFSSATGILGAYATAYVGHILTPEDLTEGLQHSFIPWFMYMSIIKSLFFAFIIASVSSFFGYTVEGESATSTPNVRVMQKRSSHGDLWIVLNESPEAAQAEVTGKFPALRRRRLGCGWYFCRVSGTSPRRACTRPASPSAP